MKRVRVPLWPGDAVVFPGQLHVLPERSPAFAEMLAFCRANETLFGSLLVTGEDGHRLAAVGTLVDVAEGEAQRLHLEAGTLIVGRMRVRLLNIYHDRPFLEGLVEVWPWDEEPAPDWVLIEQVGRYLQRYGEAFAELMPPAWLPELLEPAPVMLGMLAGAIVHLPPHKKQRLLATPTVWALLRAVLPYLRWQVPVAERLAAMVPRTADLAEQALLN